jgi:hypothetical protein
VRRRIVHTIGAGIIALCTFEVVTLIAGFGWGWLRTSTAADRSFTFVTPVDGISKVVTDVTHLFDLDLTVMSVRNVLAVVGLLIAGAIGTWLLIRAPIDGVTRNLGITLLVLAILSPILWAWYVTWGILVVAPAASGRLRTTIIFISTFEVFVGAASVLGMFRTLNHAGVLPDLALAAALVAVAIVPLNQWHVWRRQRDAAPSEVERPMAALGA